MTKNEVKVTKTIEEVVRTEYIAYDGEKFDSESECVKYEGSAFCVVKNKLNRIVDGDLGDINEESCGDYEIEIFDIPAAEDLANLKQYVYLKLNKNCPGMSKASIDSELKRLNSLTHGHEVLICWSYEGDTVWCYGDGSAKAYGEYYEHLYTNIMNRAIKGTNGNGSNNN